MKKLLIGLLTLFTIPNAVYSENNKNDAWNRATANFYLMGGLMTTCFAHKNGLISAVEKEDLMRFNIKMLRELHEISEYYIVDQVDKFKKVRKAFPDCYREVK